MLNKAGAKIKKINKNCKGDLNKAIRMNPSKIITRYPMTSD